MNFFDHLTAETNTTTTENGAKAYSTTRHFCLDFFALGAAKRNSPREALGLFQKAFHEDKQTAIRILFYIRDIRGGQGERSIFRTCLKWLAEQHTDIFLQIFTYVPEYGRWDDILDFPQYREVAATVAKQLTSDLQSEVLSLLAKWMPSENASSKRTRALAKKWQAALQMKPRAYRQTLSICRKKIKLLEQQMSANQWESIEYSKVSGQAFHKHIKAFTRHDYDRFTKFLDTAKKVDTAKGDKPLIKTYTLYTYQAFDLVKGGGFDAADALWANLPDYGVQNALVMADVSGSMVGRPMSISVSLALYYAERAKGEFHNKFMTFSSDPQLVEVKGDTLREKMRSIETAKWEMNTDLNKAMDAILQAALLSKPEEVPKVLYVISDMEFDASQRSHTDWYYGTVSSPTPYHYAKEKWEAAGIPMPTIVFWNVNSYQNQVPTMNEEGVVLVSGASTSTFKLAVEGKSPLEVMNEVVNSDRYKQIIIE